MKKIFTLVLSLFLFSISTFSQEMREVNFNTRINQSQLIVEGKVISKRSFWDDNYHNIYTASKIEVYKVFKGFVSTSFIEVISPGGIVGTQKEVVHPSLELDHDDIGIFMLTTNTVQTPNSPTLPIFQAYASEQGFIEYHLAENKASGVFDSFNNIDQQLYNTVSGLTNTGYMVVKPFSVKQFKTPSNKATPSITNFTPTTVTAGTATQLTINGSNFGATEGTVSFADANDGGSGFYDALSTQIISWSNTQIVVEVPDRAGTGNIRVTNTDPASITSGSSLTITYAELNVESDAISSGIDVAYPTQHIDENGSGGYTWQMFTDFASGAGNAAFVRAFESWTSCSGTKINWTIGSTTTTDVIASDGINVIRDDNGSELPNGTLGRCTSRYSGCINGSSIDWYVSELDIVFDDGTNWNYTTSAPGGSEYDFETVAVHELGHGHQLGHVISPGAIMHYSITNGTQNRTPSTNDLAAGNDVMSRSTGSTVCSQSTMTALSCAVAPVADFSGTPTSLCEGATVSFTDLSTNTPTGWSWSFTGGTPSTSTSQNPTITYSSAGTYAVTLTATNSSGSDGETKTGYITVNSCAVTPVADFSANATTVCDGNSLNFTDASTNTPTSWAWSFSPTTVTYLNSTSASSQNPEVQFNGAGNYSVTLVATNAFGFDTEVKSSYITANTCINNKLRAIDCGIVMSDYANFIMCEPDPGATDIEYEFSNAGLGYLQTISKRYKWRNVYMYLVPGIQNNTTYDVRVRSKKNGLWSNYGTTCQITTPANSITTQLRSNDCGTTLTDYIEYVMCDIVPGASDVEYEFSNTGLGYLQTVSKPYKWRNIYLYTVPGLQNNTVYDVRVKVKINGVWGNYGSICQITTPTSPITIKLRNSDCGKVISNYRHYILCDILPGATSFEFEFTNTSLSFNQVVSSSTRSLFVNQVPGIQLSTSYDVRVRGYVSGQWTDYGTICQITTPATARLGNVNPEEEVISEDEKIATNLDMVIYPNPNQGNFIYMDLKGLQANAELYVNDISGKTVHQQQLEADYGNYNGTLRFNEKLNAGFYMITVVSGTQKMTKKLVVR